MTPEKYIRKMFAGYAVKSRSVTVDGFGKLYSFTLERNVDINDRQRSFNTCVYQIYIENEAHYRRASCRREYEQAKEMVEAFNRLFHIEETKGGNDADEEAPDHGNARPGNGEIHG